jgi:hypothetical protein
MCGSLTPGVSEGSHTHAGFGALEELYWFLEGVGTMWVNGEDLAVAAGDTVLVPAGPGCRNTATAPLKPVLVLGEARELIAVPRPVVIQRRIRHDPLTCICELHIQQKQGPPAARVPAWPVAASGQSRSRSPPSSSGDGMVKWS